ncbi:MAG: hypothetical protein A2888_03460 [Chlamydiae bacterium RIFCSPLOWO2_01_FULL_28_7]|nr:MAG: hypothetical protein A2888_03460 [Chlamydiae bacterium RIFCSPLOWO2_01_FULL_28_7]
MNLKTLRLHNFRNYKRFEINFSKNINLIIADNAKGKTNLLEAIYLLSTGKSFKTSNLSELIHHEKTFFFIEAEFEKNSITESIKIYYDLKQKKVLHNSTNYPSLSSVLGIMPSILLHPDDISLIKGRPQNRRTFLNLFLAQKDPLYVHHYLRYLKALKNKNFLLKTKNFKNLKYYENELIKSGSYIIKQRKDLLKNLEKNLKNSIFELSSLKIDSNLKYISTIDYENDIEDSFQKILQKNFLKERNFKTSLFGPHRDDFQIIFNDKSVKYFASEGQKKLLLFALKYSEYFLLKESLNFSPLFLIDDFDSHLDRNHKMNVLKEFSKFNQVFLTTPNLEEIENTNIIRL